MNGVPPAWMISEILKIERLRLADSRPRLSIETYIPPEKIDSYDENDEEEGPDPNE